MRLPFVAALAIVVTYLPLAAAQAPDPTPVVEQACAAVGGVDPQARDLIPFCPRQDPAAAPAASEEAAAAPAGPEPSAAEGVASLVDETLEDAKRIPEDPAGAADRIASILARVIESLNDLLELPADISVVVGADLAAIGGEVSEGASAVRDAAAQAIAAVKELFTLPAREPAAPSTPKVEAPRVVPVAEGLLSRALDLSSP